MGSNASRVIRTRGKWVMGILSAMNKSVGGLNAQSLALENISGNIANAQTTAFKRTDTSFADLVQSGASSVALMTSGNVRATARSTIALPGAVENSSIDTFMGIKGDGFFIVKQRIGEVDGSTVFGSGQVYTRRGDFQINKEGYLVNGAGYFLTALEIDPTTDNPVGDTSTTIEITKNPIPAEVTSKIDYRLNLPTTPFTTFSQANPSIANGNIWAANSSRVGPPSDGIITGDLKAEFIANSISGEAVTVYDTTGNPINVQLRWAKTAANQWQLFHLNDANATGTATAWTRIDIGSGNSTFDFTDGLITDSVDTISIPTLTVGTTTLSDLTLSFGATGVTQFADTSGSATVRQLTQDGLPAGDFKAVAISDGGRVVVSYTNGKTQDLYQIPLASFSGQSWLRPLDGGAYAETKESGPPTNGSGTIVGNALESSNVDIGEEFTKLIVTQQAFSANSKVITTADQMMNDVLNIIR